MRQLLGFGVMALALSCTDVGVVGQDSVCPTVCAADERCDPKLKTCVRCTPGTACERAEPSVCEADAERGEPECVACRRDSDCPANTPFCHDGRCGECIEDDDCGQNAECKDQRCELATDEPDISDDSSGARDAAAPNEPDVPIDAGDDDVDGTGGMGSDDR
jgi:hypothetical protein